MLPADQPLPQAVRFRDLVPSGWGVPPEAATSWDDEPHRTVTATSAEDDVPDADCDWAVVEMPERLQRLAVAATAGQFEHLEHYWRPKTGPARPLTDGLHDVSVSVDGSHPATRVTVTFRHPAYPEGRMRRTYRVFDSAGRIRVDDHLAIWLMEDLDTGDLPPVSSAVDGVLDI